MSQSSRPELESLSLIPIKPSSCHHSLLQPDKKDSSHRRSAGQLVSTSVIWTSELNLLRLVGFFEFCKSIYSPLLLEGCKGGQKFHIMSGRSASAVRWCDQNGHRLTVMSSVCAYEGKRSAFPITTSERRPSLQTPLRILPCFMYEAFK